MKIKLAAAAVAILGFASLPMASHAAEAAKNPFSQCGIGAALFPDNGVAATISNVIWDIGTTAVTSGLSSPSTCSGNSSQVAMIINSSYANLETEAAIGEGKYLTAVADAMDCSADARAPLYAEVRARFEEEVAAPGYTTLDKTQKAVNLYNIVDQTVSSKFAAQCSMAS